MLLELIHSTMGRRQLTGRAGPVVLREIKQQEALAQTSP